MAAIKVLNPKAEFARASQALAINITGATGIQDIMKSNLGPKGTMKMLVSGSGDIKITKDGNVLLHEMRITHPTASLIARASTAIDCTTGDGTTSAILIIGELLKQAERYISEGVHPRVITEGFQKSKSVALDVLNDMKIPVNENILLNVARTSLQTKVHFKLADILADVCVSAVTAIQQPGISIDLHMVEIMEMQHKTDTETTLIYGLVLDHGSRHPDMPKKVTDAYILTCNVSLEYEKSEINSGFFYKTAEQREKMVIAERELIDQRIQKVIALKNKLCNNTGKSFVVINQKGIDPFSLEAFAKEGIIALRRAKRRNMERLVLACGGTAVNSFDDLHEEHLGFSGVVYEQVLGEDKFTFVEECKFPKSVTILIKGPNKHTLIQVKDAVKDGLRVVKNAIEDEHVIPGAGAFELRASQKLVSIKDTFVGKIKLGIQAYAEALLIIPKTLAVNSGFDAQDSIVKLLEECRNSGNCVGLSISTGEPIDAVGAGIFDNVIVKEQYINSCTVIASNLLLVDEIMRAGLSSLKG